MDSQPCSTRMKGGPWLRCRRHPLRYGFAVRADAFVCGIPWAATEAPTKGAGDGGNSSEGCSELPRCFNLRGVRNQRPGIWWFRVAVSGDGGGCKRSLAFGGCCATYHCKLAREVLLQLCKVPCWGLSDHFGIPCKNGFCTI